MEEVRQKSWFGRNWLWVVPISGCLMVILLIVFGIGAAIFGVTKVLKNSSPYTYAFELAEENENVKYSLGKPIVTDGVMSGSININNDHGEVDFRIPIKGSKRKGTIIVVGEKYDGIWTYEKLYVLIKETNEEINLLDKSLEGF
ncbi:cytochrome c oxidase assembly factor Coa1 family protein [Geojedonia litorea]|uniref:Cytochrome c oxidase assembly factor Coa1 family protein n=1 Tax=Geojedonia litorea TaxID=1268269 RepID=A0ABV9N443_9FLAO